MNQKRVLIPIPSYGCDPSEVAIPWKQLTNNNIIVGFATPNGKKASADSIMVNGTKLGVLKSLLYARKDAVTAFYEMGKSIAFNNPIKYTDISEQDFDAILLPGGHDKSVKEYLESEVLQQLIVAFFKAKKPVAAICHGVVLVARSVNAITGKSVIYNYKTTALLKSQELLAYNLTRTWMGDYYLTYPGLTVEDEVKAVLSNSSNFIKGSIPILRDSPNKMIRGFVVKDRNYLSARWPGDLYNFSETFIKMIQEL